MNRQTVTLFITIIQFTLLCEAGMSTVNEYEDPSEGCTVGVASGRATPDGRPLLWKTRDAEAINNEVYYQTAYPIRYVCVISAGITVNSWMGVNEKGFAIINSASSDLPGGTSGLGNGTIMAYALGHCLTVAEFQHLLDSTNVTGRQTQANFGVIDSTGAAAIFETGGNEYWKFDANDSTQAPAGYILRTNFAVNGGGSTGIQRYQRTCALMANFNAGDSLNYRSILRHQMRDFSDYYSNPFQIPYPFQLISVLPAGYIYTEVSICRNSTVSTAVIHGVLPQESAKLSTMWVILGQPAGSIAVPYWPVGTTPAAANGPATAPLCNCANLIRTELFDQSSYPSYINTYALRDGQGKGIWPGIFSSEDSIFLATDSILQSWRSDTLNVSGMLTYESACADYALAKLQQIHDTLTTILSQNEYQINSNFQLYSNYPNPFNPSTTITFRLPKSSQVTLKILNILGEEVTILISGQLHSGIHSATWDATGFASGVYFYELRTDHDVEMRKMILMK